MIEEKGVKLIVTGEVDGEEFEVEVRLKPQFSAKIKAGNTSSYESTAAIWAEAMAELGAHFLGELGKETLIDTKSVNVTDPKKVSFQLKIKFPNSEAYHCEPIFELNASRKAITSLTFAEIRDIRFLGCALYHFGAMNHLAANMQKMEFKPYKPGNYPFSAN